MANKFILKVTAGSDYDLKSQVDVPVNASAPVKVSNEFMDIELNVRIQNYHGLPYNSPITSPYFSTAPHDKNADQYSISFKFTPKKPDVGVSGRQSRAGSVQSKPSSTSGSRAASRAPSLKERIRSSSRASKNSDVDKADDNASSEAARDDKGISATDLQFGNDFDHPIRDRLPPGFGTAMNIVKWWIDPGLEGDPYAESPYLYGPGLSSFNALYCGDPGFDEAKGGIFVEEGGDEAGLEDRRGVGCPDDSKARMKWALRKDAKEKFLFEYGKSYAVDFFNPYLDFGEFTLKLPGFSLPIMKYWDGQGLRAKPKRSHCLRYVLRNRTTEDTYLVVLFSLYLKEDVNEDGSLKPSAFHDDGTSTAKGEAVEGGVKEDRKEHQDDKSIEETRKKLEGTEIAENNDDDVD